MLASYTSAFVFVSHGEYSTFKSVGELHMIPNDHLFTVVPCQSQNGLLVHMLIKEKETDMGLTERQRVCKTERSGRREM